MKSIFKIIYFYISVVWTTIAMSQNLVPNPSFETHSTCTGILEIRYYGNTPDIVHPWYSPNTATPDYFNSCANWTNSVPSNEIGYQQARTGNAYAGILAYYYDGSLLNYREYLGVRLIDSLLAGNTYCISFYLSVTPYLNNTYTRSFSLNKIGVYLSNIPAILPNSFQNYYNLPYTPQIVSDSNIYLTDTLNWTEISGEYHAHGGEKYITIGNFNDDANTDTLFMATNHLQGSKSAYYFIDDVSLIKCNVGVEENEEETLKIYPNPATNSISITTNNEQLKTIYIVNVYGEKVMYQQVTVNTQQLSIDVSSFAKGIYFLEAETEKGIIRKKLVKE